MKSAMPNRRLLMHTRENMHAAIQIGSCICVSREKRFHLRADIKNIVSSVGSAYAAINHGSDTPAHIVSNVQVAMWYALGCLSHAQKVAKAAKPKKFVMLCDIAYDKKPHA